MKQADERRGPELIIAEFESDMSRMAGEIIWLRNKKDELRDVLLIVMKHTKPGGYLHEKCYEAIMESRHTNE